MKKAKDRDMDGWLELQEAIFLLAIKDYRTAVKKVKNFKKKLGTLTDRQYLIMLGYMDVIIEIEEFADSELGAILNPFELSGWDTFKEGLGFIKSKCGAGILISRKGEWADRLYRAFRDSGKPQWRVAKAAGMTNKQLGYNLSGKAGHMQRELLLAVCREIDISPVYIVFGTDKESFREWERKQKQ